MGRGPSRYSTVAGIFATDIRPSGIVPIEPLLEYSWSESAAHEDCDLQYQQHQSPPAQLA